MSLSYSLLHSYPLQLLNQTYEGDAILHSVLLGNNTQVPLVIGSQLATPVSTAVVVSQAAVGTTTWCQLVLRSQQQQPPQGHSAGTLKVGRRSLFRKGGDKPSRWTDLAVTAAAGFTNTASCAPSTTWQLQRGTPVPALGSWLEQQPQLTGKITACHLLVPAQLQQPAQQLKYQQQLQELQQLLQATQSAFHGAAQAALTAAGAPWSDSQLPATLQLLAAAACVASAEPDQARAIKPGSACAAAGEPLYCSPTLYTALDSALQQQQSVVASMGSRSSNVQGAPLELACMLCVGTSSGQVWLVDSRHVLRGLMQQKDLPDQNLQQQDEMQEDQLSCEQCRQQPEQHGLQLLLDLQQPIAAVVPVTNRQDGTPALLVVGSLGRLLLLQQEQPQQQQQQLQPGRSCLNPPQLSVSQQLQLPFRVAAAATVSTNSSSISSSRANGGAQQGTSPQLLLLLLSSSGQLYATSLSALFTDPSATTMQTAGQQLQGAAAGAAMQGMQLTALQPTPLTLPGPVSRLWALNHEALHAMNNSSSSRSIGAAAAAAGNSPQSAGTGSNIVIVQLVGSKQLLELSCSSIMAATLAASQQESSTNNIVHGAAQQTMSAAAVAARRRLQQLTAGLEIIASARQQLGQAAALHDDFMQAIKQDMVMLGLQAPPVPGTTAAAAAGGASASLQQQHQQGTKHILPLPGSHAAAAAGISCELLLQGLWPVAASTGLASGSQMYMAVTVNLKFPNSHGSISTSLLPSNRLRLSATAAAAAGSGLGPGWQLVVCFTPECSHSSSWQTTMELQSRACSSIQASMLLPLPAACSALHEGGWLTVYAVKQPPPPTATAQHWQQQQQQLWLDGPSRKDTLLPVVTMLQQQYVSVLQLASMAAANPVAGLMTAQSPGAWSTHCRRPATPAGASSSPASYSCMLRLQCVSATPSSSSGRSPPDGENRQPANPPAKRLRSEAAGPNAAQSAQQQQHTAQAAQSSMLHFNHQQQPKQQTEVGQPPAMQHLSRLLESWLGQVLPTGSAATGLPGQPRSIDLHPGNTPLLGNSWQQCTAASAGLAALQSHFVYRLASGDVSRVDLCMQPTQLLPSVQLLHVAAAGAAGAAAAAATTRAKRANATEDADGTSGGSSGQSLDVKILSSSVSSLAQVHRALLLGLADQLTAASENSSDIRSCHSSGEHEAAQVGLAAAWRISTSQQHLKLALSRLRTLQQHAMALQGAADKARCCIEVLYAAAGRSSAAQHGDQPNRASQHMLQAAGVQQQQQQEEEPDKVLQDLLAVADSWQRGLHAVYGQLLLATSDAARIECHEHV